MTFQFDLDEDGTISVEGAIFQALGAASMCWESMDGTGVFQSDRAKEIGDALVAKIREDMHHPYLGLAKTGELLDELRSRIEIDYFVGGGGLDYTTVGGRPQGTLEAPDDERPDSPFEDPDNDPIEKG